MNINTVTLANSYKVLLMEDVFPVDLLASISVLCSLSEVDDSGWEYAEWSQFRKIHNGSSDAYQSIRQYLSSSEFREPIESIIKQKMFLTDLALWADYPGFGSLLPHVEQHGQCQGQIFLTTKEYPTNGTSMLNDDKQLLFTLPYRNNFGWHMEDCKQIMHSRQFDVPADIVRYSLIYWHSYET